MKNRTVLLYMTFVFLSNFSTILYFLTVYLEFVGFSMVAISSMMIAYQVSKFILEVTASRPFSSAVNRCVCSQRFCRCMCERIHRSDLH